MSLAKQAVRHFEAALKRDRHSNTELENEAVPSRPPHLLLGGVRVGHCGKTEDHWREKVLGPLASLSVMRLPFQPRGVPLFRPRLPRSNRPWDPHFSSFSSVPVPAHIPVSVPAPAPVLALTLTLACACACGCGLVCVDAIGLAFVPHVSFVSPLHFPFALSSLLPAKQLFPAFRGVAPPAPAPAPVPAPVPVHVGMASASAAVVVGMAGEAEIGIEGVVESWAEEEFGAGAGIQPWGRP